tara:strand:- start:755 stop:1165 length:411 start_codon:yes stop_codon:yes gene_type:complete
MNFLKKYYQLICIGIGFTIGVFFIDVEFVNPWMEEEPIMVRIVGAQFTQYRDEDGEYPTFGYSAPNDRYGRLDFRLGMSPDDDVITLRECLALQSTFMRSRRPITEYGTFVSCIPVKRNEDGEYVNYSTLDITRDF